MRALLLILIATLLLAVSFSAFFPQFAILTLTGNYTVGLSIDETARNILWLIGVISFFAALGLYAKAFTQ